MCRVRVMKGEVRGGEVRESMGNKGRRKRNENKEK